MNYRDVVIAELRMKAATHLLRAAKLKYDNPGEGVAIKGRRFRDWQRNYWLGVEYDAVAKELSTE